MNFHAEDFYFNRNAALQNKTQWSLSQCSLQNNSKQKAEDFRGRIVNEIKKKKKKTSIKAWWRKKRGL